MSFIRKSCIALIAALLPGALLAGEIEFSPMELGIHVREARYDDNSVAGVGATMVYNLLPGDPMLGRKAPFRVTIALQNAEWASTQNPPKPVVDGQEINWNWTISDPQTDRTHHSFTMTSGGSHITLRAGALFTLTPPTFMLKKLPTSDTVTAIITLTDPASGQVLSAGEHVVMTLASGVEITQSEPTVIEVSRTAKRVDGQRLVQLGYIDALYADGDPVRPGRQAIALLTPGLPYNALDNRFSFSRFDTFRVTLFSTQAAFFPVAGAPNQSMVGVHISAADQPCTEASPMLTRSGTAGGMASFVRDVTLPRASRFRLCAVLNGEDVIQSGAIIAVGQIRFDLSPHLRNVQSPLKSLAEFRNPEHVVNVEHFNPAGNADQQSYLRIRNPGSATAVTIEGVCDNGVVSPTPITFTLGDRRSILVTSVDVENGNSAKGLANGLGACTAGKRSLTVVSDRKILVQNFLRNYTSGGMINTNVNNEH